MVVAITRDSFLLFVCFKKSVKLRKRMGKSTGNLYFLVAVIKIRNKEWIIFGRKLEEINYITD